MKTSVRQLCILLAATNFDRKQLQTMFDEVTKESPRRLLSEVDSMRKRLDSGEFLRDSTTTQQPTDTLAARITELLVAEAGFTKIEVFDRLQRSLIDTFPGRFVAPGNPKSGFSAWVKNLSKEFSGPELLHVVTRLRNSHVHGETSKDDWLHRKDML